MTSDGDDPFVVTLLALLLMLGLGYAGWSLWAYHKSIVLDDREWVCTGHPVFDYQCAQWTKVGKR